VRRKARVLVAFGVLPSLAGKKGLGRELHCTVHSVQEAWKGGIPYRLPSGCW
jgi:hypothetical protein